MSREKTDTKNSKPQKFTDSKINTKVNQKLLPAPKESITHKTTDIELDKTIKKDVALETKITDNSQTQKEAREAPKNIIPVIEHKQDIIKNEEIITAEMTRKPAKLEVDVVNDTTKAKQQKQKIRITLILLALFYMVGILLGGGILSRLNAQNISDSNKAEVLANQIQPTQNSELTNQQTNELQITTPPPQTTAKAYGVFYKQKKQSQFLQIAEKEADTQLPPASISKLMTALLIVEKYPLSKQIVFPAKCQNIADGTNAGFKTGDILSIQDLLYGMLVASGADASCALSTIDENTNFISEMNKKAEKLNMTNTKFQNAIGFDAENSQISSVNDLIILINEILKYNTIRKIVGTEVVEIKPQNTSAVYRITSTNDLLKTIPGTIGIKTGSTPLAGECLAYLYEEKDAEILIIILGSQKRFADTQTLLNWAKKQQAN